MILLLVFIGKCWESVSFCEGMTFISASSKMEPVNLDCTSKAFWLKIWFKESLPDGATKDPCEISCIPHHAHTPEKKNLFLSIDNYFEMSKKRGGGSLVHMHPFFSELFPSLIQIEKKLGLTVGSINELHPLEHPICAQIYKAFPPLTEETRSFYIQNFGILNNQFKLVYAQTGQNPLMFYAYTSYVYFNLLFHHLIVTNFSLLPTEDALNNFYITSMDLIKYKKI